MSTPHSPTPPTRLSAAASETGDQLVRNLDEVAELVSNFGFYGVIWLNRELIVTGTYGRLVDFVAIDAPLSESVLPLIGLENEILELERDPSRVLELPAVGFASADNDNRKLNFTFFWHRDRNVPMAIAYRSSSQTELELELSKQIRARLMAEAEVTAKSKELARANTDLESFAAVVSHDLKAPLRYMRYLADQLAARHSDQDVMAALGNIKAQIERMSSMLSSLLSYSSIGRKEQALEQVDTAHLIGDITRSLRQPGHTITVNGSWPVITTLRAPLDLVLRNLVGNAQQHHDRDTGSIRVDCTETATGLTITIADDGPGIDARHHDAIFLPFRTLAPEGRESSTGMGLAMVKKTVENAGGSITIHSVPAERRGTTFTVLWPKCIAG